MSGTPVWVKNSPGFSNGKTASENFNETRDTHFTLALMVAHQSGLPMMPEYNTAIVYNGSGLVDNVILTHESDGTKLQFWYDYTANQLTSIEIWYTAVGGGASLRMPKGKFVIGYNGSGQPDSVTNSDIP